MGRKSRVKTQKSGTGATAVVSPKEMMNLISDLLQKCSSAAPSPGKEWEEYIQIRGLVEKIRKKQKGISVIFEGSREEFFPELMAWAQENGASCEGVEIAHFAGEGFGLRATKDIKAEELFLWIPRTMLMTVESAKNSVLGPLYSQDRILQAMGNVTLALHLLCERADPSSPWLPYIKTLPGDYDTPLYYEEEEVGVDASLIQEASKKVSLASLDAGQSASPAQEEDGMDAKFTTPDAADPPTSQEQEGQTENGGDKATASLSQEVDVDLSAEGTGDVNSE
uniref:protein-histidine N-methyltransferase n=1 Tax=Salmo salar TaxID=8030 RepID=B5X5C5_SALSA|nr:SET domain-containing protein 3 [Salmo salar]